MHNVLKGVRFLSSDLADQILRSLNISILDLLDRGVYMARRGMIILSLAQDEAAFGKMEAAIEDFVRVRRRFLA